MLDLEKYTLTRIISVAEIRKTQGMLSDAIQVRERENNVLLYRATGQSVYVREGQRILCDRNCVAFLPKGISYNIEPNSYGMNISVLFETLEPIEIPWMFLYLNNHEQLYELFITLSRVWSLRACGYIAQSKSLIYQIISQIKQAFSLSGENSPQHRRLQPALAYLNKHYSDPDLSVKELVRISGVSETSFRNAFREVFGLPPVQYLCRLRINRATDLLLSGAVTVSEASVLVGFRSPFYFSEAFKYITGLRPSEFMKKQQKTTE